MFGGDFFTGGLADPGTRGWLGQTHDTVTGTIHLNARDHQPQTGRFTTPDPLFDLARLATLNPYAYAGNNPIGAEDSSGLLTAHTLPDGDRSGSSPRSSGGGSSTSYGDDRRTSSVGGTTSSVGGTTSVPQIPGRRVCPVPGAPCGYISGYGDDGDPLPGDSALIQNSRDDVILPIAKTATLDPEDCERFVSGTCAFAAITIGPWLKWLKVLRAGEKIDDAAKGARVAEGSLSPTLQAGDRSFIYGDRVLARAKEAGDSYHNFPASFDTEILTRGTRTEISDGYVQYTLRGNINGVDGVYEIGARPSGLADAEVITHRFFRPGG